MPHDIEETPLPGVGVRYTFQAEDGQRISVLVRQSGARELFVELPDDPDRSRRLLALGPVDSRILADLMGGSEIQRELGRLPEAVGELGVDYVEVESGSPGVGRTIGQLQLRSTTGAIVAAVLRQGELIEASPGPDVRLQAGDTLVVVGEPVNLIRARDLFRAA